MAHLADERDLEHTCQNRKSTKLSSITRFVGQRLSLQYTSWSALRKRGNGNLLSSDVLYYFRGFSLMLCPSMNMWWPHKAVTLFSLFKSYPSFYVRQRGHRWYFIFVMPSAFPAWITTFGHSAGEVGCCVLCLQLSPSLCNRILPTQLLASPGFSLAALSLRAKSVLLGTNGRDGLLSASSSICNVYMAEMLPYDSGQSSSLPSSSTSSYRFCCPSTRRLLLPTCPPIRQNHLPTQMC